MKTMAIIEAELANLIQGHYYSEDFELISAFRAYECGLSVTEKDGLAEVAFRRLVAEGSMVDILLCSVVHVPSAVPVLVEKLNRETQSNQVTRTLITALKNYATDEAYMAVERFLDSDQELETLQALAQMDFIRTLPYMVRLMKKEHTHGVVLHILHDRMKNAGRDGLIRDLHQSTATRSESFRENLARTLQSKKGGYNPFSGEDILRIIQSGS